MLKMFSSLTDDVISPFQKTPYLREKIEMPAPYVVKFFDESWYSDAFGWHFYEREELEESTYDGIFGK